MNAFDNCQYVTRRCPNFGIASNLQQIDLTLARYTIDLDQVAFRSIEISDHVGSGVGFEDEHVGAAAAGQGIYARIACQCVVASAAQQ